MATTTTNTISFLNSNKGNRLLVLNGFIYKINKQSSSKIYWICKTKSCQGHVHTDLNNNFLNSSSKHNHLDEPEELEIKQLRGIIKAFNISRRSTFFRSAKLIHAFIFYEYFLLSISLL
jgi:hypothetical protein